MPTSDFKCQTCSQSFFRKQHLEMHTKHKHTEAKVDSLDKSTSALNIESVDLYVQQEASQKEEDRLPRQEKESAEQVSWKKQAQVLHNRVEETNTFVKDTPFECIKTLNWCNQEMWHTLAV